MTLGLLIAITLAVALLALLEEEGDRFYKPYIYWSLAIVLILLVATREVGFDRDSLTYEYRFLHPDDVLALVKEPTFVALVALIRSFSYDVHWLFACYAILGVSLKWIAFRRLAPMFFLPIAIYMGNYFILHELTQIRAGVASAFFLLALPYIAQGRRWAAFALIAAAVMFHFSALVYFSALALTDKPLTMRWRIALASIPPIGYALYVLNIDILTIVYIPFLTDKIEFYQRMRDKGIAGEAINVFNAVFLVKILIYFYLLYFYNTLVRYAHYISLLLKVMALSIIFMLFFAGLPVVAFRVSELFGIVDIILYSYLFYTLRPAWFGRAIIVVVSLALFAINVFYVKIFEPV